jgi:N-acetylglucosaminyldiphosphoundecaprenol N-acetyl-beta-D-mannosaminyltransferase
MTSSLDSLARLTDAIRIVADDADRARLLDGLLAPDRPIVLGFINAHGFNLAAERPEVLELFLGVDVLLRDGKGMEMLLSGLGRDPGLNMNGTDLIPELLAHLGARPLAVLGTAEPWLGRACDRLAAEGRAITARLDGFQPDAAYDALVARTRPEAILLAMGMPRQERAAMALRASEPDRPMLIICGGAIVDFLAARFDRAPVWVRSLGMEWAWRLLREPRRLFQRYVIGNALFMLRARRLRRHLR